VAYLGGLLSFLKTTQPCKLSSKHVL